MFESLVFSGFVIAATVLCFWLIWEVAIVIPYDMAQERNRDGTAWVIISLIGSPFLAIFLLWWLGKK